MKIIFSSPQLIEVTQLKDRLEEAGIASFIRNEISSGLSGDIPLNESMPELWIENDGKLEEVCPACGEKLEPQFTSCWKCGATKKN